MRTVAGAIVLAGLLIAGAVLARGDVLILAVSAPKASDSMTIFLASDVGPLEKYRDLTAEYEIHYGDRLIYPPTGRGATFAVEDKRGTAVVPYDLFVVGNGEYDVVVRYAGEATRSRVTVQKWVEHVWVRPFERADAIHLETALSTATGGRPEDRVLAMGEIIFTLRYHGTDGERNVVVGQVTAETRHDRTSTSIPVPKARFTHGPGYYSFEPLFHNQEARNNVQVDGDPTMANLRPPSNWIFVR